MPQPVIVTHISTCTIQPNPPLDLHHQNPIIDLAPFDLPMLSVHHIQKGHLFYNPPPSQPPLLDRLKDSLSLTLALFFPLAGRLVTLQDTTTSASRICIDLTKPEAEFIHAKATDLIIAHVLAPGDVPDFVKSFFPYDGAVNQDWHSLPLLSVQLTELRDGVFIGCSFNHVVGDGISFWNFFTTWAQIARGEHVINPPITERFFFGYKSPVWFPFSNPIQFIKRRTPPPLRKRIFHFSAQSMKNLKSKANTQSNTDKISSFQALSAHVWLSITRARHFPPDQRTSCRLAVDNRPRLNPPLSPNYFGNFIQSLNASTTVGELQSHDLGWAAWLVHESVVGHTEGVVREATRRLMEAPSVNLLNGWSDPCSILVGGSPRFDMYGCDFGWGKAVAIRSGYAKSDGIVLSGPGREGGGSVDLEVCLFPETMGLLEMDEEFMEVVSLNQLEHIGGHHTTVVEVADLYNKKHI